MATGAPLLRATPKSSSLKKPQNHSHVDLPDDAEDEEGLPQTGENAVVSLLWIDTYPKGKKQATDDDIANQYHEARKQIADALILGASLQGSSARRILLVSETALRLCGSQILSKFWEIRYIRSLLNLNIEQLRDEQSIRNCIALTQLRALELTEFRKILIIDLSFVARKGSKLDNLFSYETPAYDRSNTGVLLLKPCARRFEEVEKKLQKWIRRGAICEPLQEYVSKLFGQGAHISGVCNIHVNALTEVDKQPVSKHEDCHSLKWDDVILTQFGGSITPQHWLFHGGPHETLEDWRQKHLQPYYCGLHADPAQMAITNWGIMWSLVQGTMTWWNYKQQKEKLWLRGPLMICQPWVKNGLNVPQDGSICKTCTMWPLHSEQKGVKRMRNTNSWQHEHQKAYPDSSQPKPVTPRPPSPPPKKPKLLVPTVKKPQAARAVHDWPPSLAGVPPPPPPPKAAKSEHYNRHSTSSDDDGTNDW